MMNDMSNAQTPLMCINCGFENRVGVKSCNVCGHELVDYNNINFTPEEDNEVVDEDLTNGPQRRPWSRYFARYVDYALFGLVISRFFPVITGVRPIVSNLVGSVLLMFIWIPVEALFISKFTATPGKWLFNISVKTDSDEPLTYTQAFQRGLKVFHKGLYWGIPIFSLIAGWDSHDRLLEKGKTIWDSEGSIRVQHKKIGTKIILIIFVFVLIIAARTGFLSSSSSLIY